MFCKTSLNEYIVQQFHCCADTIYLCKPRWYFALTNNFHLLLAYLEFPKILCLPSHEHLKIHHFHVTQWVLIHESLKPPRASGKFNMAVRSSLGFALVTAIVVLRKDDSVSLVFDPGQKFLHIWDRPFLKFYSSCCLGWSRFFNGFHHFVLVLQIVALVW